MCRDADRLVEVTSDTAGRLLMHARGLVRSSEDHGELVIEAPDSITPIPRNARVAPTPAGGTAPHASGWSQVRKTAGPLG